MVSRVVYVTGCYRFHRAAKVVWSSVLYEYKYDRREGVADLILLSFSGAVVTPPVLAPCCMGPRYAERVCDGDDS